MGEITLRGIDEAVLAKLRAEAEVRGLALDDLAAELIAAALVRKPARTLQVARRVLSAQTDLSPISSVDLLREIRDEVR